MISKKARLILGFVLLIIGFFDLNPSKINDFINHNIVKPVPVVVVDKPSDELIALTKPVADVILDKDDKKHFAIFINEFSNRKYKDITLQTVNNIITAAAKDFFGDSIKGKYKSLPDDLKKLLSVQAIESADNALTDLELKEISNRFKALAWNLAQ